MKCRKCNAELRDTDKICLNCGTLVKSSSEDLYADINVDDEDEDVFDEESENKYSNELDQLLNSYHQDQQSVNMTSDFPDYSSFAELNENKDLIKNEKATKDESFDNSLSNNTSIEDTSSEELPEYTIDNLVTLTSTKKKNNKKEEKPKVKQTKEIKTKVKKENTKKVSQKKITNKSFTTTRSDFSLSLIPFKVIFIIALVILLVLLSIFVYKLLNGNIKKVKHEIKNDETLITSKYSLTENPNYINGRTWVCGDADSNGELTLDTKSYFQYDFNLDNTYATEVLNSPDTLEYGRYGVSLEEISDNKYTYKVTLIATLDNSYKTRYSFTLVTNKEGTKGTYKLNGKTSVCEEMEYYNSKVKK